MSEHDTDKVKWEEMFPDELYQKIREQPVCYLAYGLAEPHGPYNALGLDWIKAYKLVLQAARAHGGVVAPPFAWHIQERPEFHDNGRGGGWLPDAGIRRPLASSIPDDLFYRLVFHQIRDVDARGFHAAVLVTGHYGGLEKTLRLICEYYTRRTGSPLQLRAMADWECIRHENFRGDHAGLCETSQLMALSPEHVDLSRRAVPPELGSRYGAGVDFSRDAALPSRELGARIVQSQVEQLGCIGRGLLETHAARADWKAPTQQDADDMWYRFERLTRKYWSLTYDEYKSGTVIEFPGWETLGENFDERLDEKLHKARS